MHPLARAVGFRFFDGGKRNWELRFSWAEITGRIGLAVGVINWSEDNDWSLNLHLGWPNIFIKLPFLPRREPKEQILDKWGFGVLDRAVHLNWGRRTKIISLPWGWTHVRTSILMVDGRSWVHEIPRLNVKRDEVPIAMPAEPNTWFSIHTLSGWKKELPYRYALRSGEIQERTATVSVDEMEWRWLATKRLPFPRMIKRNIRVNFSDEVGEQTGTWKGGCTGCGYTMRRDETPEECLRRMEQERKF